MGSICFKANSDEFNPDCFSPLGFRATSMVAVNRQNIKKDYIIDRVLGYGSFGEVNLAYHRVTNSKYAVKKILCNRENFEQVSFIQNEIQTLKNCVSLYSYSIKIAKCQSYLKFWKF